MQKDRENYCACLEILLFCAVSECYARAFEWRLVFDLDRTADLERYLELQADMKLLIDPVAELANLRAAAIRYIVNGAPDSFIDSKFDGVCMGQVAEKVKFIRDNF